MPIASRDVQEIRLLAVLMLKIPRQRLEQRFADEGIDLTMLQYHIMEMAYRHQYTIADLSRTFGLDPSTLVPTVDALVKKGLLVRERDPHDRRRYPLHLTTQGQNLRQHLCRDLGDDPLDVALRTLDEDGLVRLRDSLRQVVRALPDGEEALADLYQYLDSYASDPEVR